jgi:hypothetical protein
MTLTIYSREGRAMTRYEKLSLAISIIALIATIAGIVLTIFLLP